MSDYDEETMCPLCMDPLDATDQAINFCQCGYKMCLWCWNQLMETAAREALPGRCPNCRTEYDKDKITMAQLDPDALQREQQRRKETKKKVTDAQHRPPKALGQVRVVQRNLVYAVGMPLSICREEVLADKQFFGAFGRIKKVSVNRSTPFSQVQKNGPSGSAYVTYYRAEDALRCIEAVDGAVWEGKTIKACFGTTKYCNAFLKGVPCNNADCLYLHDIAEANDSFSKEDMMVNGLVTGRSTFFDMVHPTSTKEAAAHAHAMLRNNGHAATPAAAAAPACSSVQAAAGGAAAAQAENRVPTPPMAIAGARRTSSTASPWGSVGAENGPATASPSRPGAAMMARWASAAQPTPPSAAPLNSPLADVEWPSLAAAAEPSDSKQAAGDQQPAAAGHAGAVGETSVAAAAARVGPPPGWGSAAAAVHLVHSQHPSASASSHPVSHPVGHHPPTAAAVVAGKASVTGTAMSKQQQQEAKQQHKVMANLGKAPQKVTAAAAAANAKQNKADAAADTVQEEQQQQLQQQQKRSDETTAAVAEALADNSNKSNVAKAANGQVNGKLTKQEAKRAAKAAAKAEKEAAKAEKAAVTKEKQAAAAAAENAVEQAEDENPGSVVDTPPAQAAKAPPGFAAAPPPPPGFVAAAANGPSRAKGPPPGFAAPTQAAVRPPPPGFEPSLLALARAGSNGNLSQQQGSSGGGAPPTAAPVGPSPLGLGGAAGSGLDSGAASVNGVGSRRSSEVGSANGTPAAAAAASEGETLSRPESRAGSVHGNAAAAAAAATPSPAAASCPQTPAASGQQQQQQLLSPSGAAAASPSMPSPVFGMQLLTPQPPLFGAAGNASSGFDINAFLGSASYDLPGATAPIPTGVCPGAFGSTLYVGHNDAVTHTPPAAAPGGGLDLGRSLFGSVGYPPVAAAASPAAGVVDAAPPLTARKQSRWGFAQQPQQPQQEQQQPAISTPLISGLWQEPQQGGVRPPPGFGGGAAAAAPAAVGSPGLGLAGGPLGFGGTGGAVNATSFFKQLLPGVNVHVAASPPTPGAVPGFGAGAAQPAGAAASTPPNPGLALLQQLQRNQQQYQQF